MNSFDAYKTMPEWHKENLKDYYILDGIYTVSPKISDKDAQLILSICQNVENENVNPFSISHYLTEHYLNGDISEKELKEIDSGDIASAVYFDDLSYINDKNEIEIC